jgi:hypothetical protein
MGVFVIIRAGVLACAVAGSAAIALGGCGSSGTGGATAGTGADRSAASLISAMKTAVRDATSMHLAGQLPNGGRPVALDIGVLRAGALAGTITQGGVPLQLIGTRGLVYVKATPAFLRELRAAAAVCAVMCGKYVQMSGSQGSELAASLSMTSLTRSLIAGLPRFTRAGTTTVRGQSAVVLRGADGSTLDVAASGKPYPLRVVAPPGRGETVLFSHWDSVAAPAAPPASQVINLSQLKAGTS